MRLPVVVVHPAVLNEGRQGAAGKAAGRAGGSGGSPACTSLASGLAAGRSRNCAVLANGPSKALLQRSSPVFLPGQLLMDASDSRQEGFEADGRLILSVVNVLVTGLVAAACGSELNLGRRHRAIVREYKYHGRRPDPQQTRGRLDGLAWILPQRGSSTLGACGKRR